MVYLTNDIALELTGMLLSIISFFMISYYFAKILTPKKESKYYVFKYFIVIILVYFLCRTSMSLYENRDNIIYLVVFILPFILSKDKFSKKILVPLSWIIITLIISIITNLITFARFGISLDTANSVPYEELVMMIGNDKYGLITSQALAYTFLSFMTMNILLITNKNLKNKFEIFLINLFSLILVAIATIPAYFLIDLNNKIHLLIGLVSFSISIFIMLFTYSRIRFFEEYYESIAENKFLKGKEKMQLDYYKIMQEKESEIKKINHDIKNNLQVMASLTNKEEKEKMMFNINEKLTQNEIIKYSKIEILNIILNLKKKEAENRNIEVLIEIRNSIDFMEEIDISNLFSNILDNAIDNISENDKKIELSIYKKMNYFVVQCCNTTDNKTKDKGKNHGYGLKIVDDIARKYNGEVNINKSDNTFEITVFFAQD